jgi:hypothetical protein
MASIFTITVNGRQGEDVNVFTEVLQNKRAEVAKMVCISVVGLEQT